MSCSSRVAALLILSCAVFIWPTTSAAQRTTEATLERAAKVTLKPLQAVAPKTVGLDEEKLNEIDALMSREVTEGRIAGCVGLVARGDEVGYLKSWGHQDRESEKPMSVDTIFRIYSMSKPITSVAAMQLVEQGKLELDAPVSKYLPAFADLRVWKKDAVAQEGPPSKDPGDIPSEPAKRAMTVRDLLRHTSGLTYGFFGNTRIDKAYVGAGILMTDKNLEQTISRLSKIPLQNQPGTRWHYGVSTDVLGRVVEVASGQKFDVYLDEHIFQPLKMVDTFFMVPETKMHRFATMYRPDKKHTKLTRARSIESFRFTYQKNAFFSGGGGLCSTTRDYLRFCQMLLHGGEWDGQRIVSAGSIEEMTKNQLTGEMKRGSFRFGLGFRIGSEGEYGWGGAAGTRFWVNPQRDLITIYMVQIKPDRGDYGKKMNKIVYAADQK